MECLSHTLTHVGEQVRVTVLMKVKQDHCALTKEGYAIREHCFEVIGTQFLHPENTRWWAFYDLYYNTKENWVNFSHFLATAVADGNVGESDSRIKHLLAVIHDPMAVAILKMELDIIIITMKPLVQGTYLQEGKGLCAIIAYDLISKFDNWFVTHLDDLTFPGMEEAISSCRKALIEAGKNYTRDNIARSICDNIAPGYNYFESRIPEMLEDDMVIYKTM